MQLIVLYCVGSIVVGCIGIWAIREWIRLDREEAARETQKAKETEKQ